MLNLDVISNNTKHEEQGYYDYRKTLHNLYDLEIFYGDLVGDILAYREKDRNIEAISIDMKDYKIYTELNEKIQDKDVDKIVNNIDDIVTNFINTISDTLDAKDHQNRRELIERYNDSNWPTFDFYINGTSIEFNL